MVTTTKSRVYQPAIGPRLHRLFAFVLLLLSLLVANSLYLAAITLMEWYRGETYENHFYMSMFLGHLGLGALFLLPFLIFGVIHWWTARQRKNKRAIRVGYGLLFVSILILATGILLIRIDGLLDLKHPLLRSTLYWIHVGGPFVALWLYWLHRLVGKKIRWKLGLIYGTVTTAAVACMVASHLQDPREWNKIGSAEGVQYFEPSLARTSNGAFISSEVLDNDEYCLNCHQDAYKSWNHSAHHFSSFNNPAYLVSVRETRDVAMKRDNNVKASRWCAGCHDPVPFFSGAFDDPKFDDVHHPTSQSGITCTACHAITHVHSTLGNADYTIEEPLHYPFAFSKNATLQWINHQLIKAKPAFHKKTFLKPFHKTSEFCATCHKVHLPFALNRYKEFLRGQNHYDSWLLSGVSGHGSRSFYYPEKAQKACAGCHMDLVESNDFGAKLYEGGAGKFSIHDHGFAAGNSGLPFLRGFWDQVEAKHKKFLEGIIRVDLFAVKEGGSISGKLHGPLRPKVPALKPGESYLLETVLRTLKVGHEFTQGTADSNEVWLEVTLKSGDRLIGSSGSRDAKGEVDRRSHFVNIFMLDRNGNRINRRNPQDIFTPLYNHQIPPGSGQVVHYSFQLPSDIQHPVEAMVRLQYRKFDYEYMKIVHDRLSQRSSEQAKENGTTSDSPIDAYRNDLPILTLASDRVIFPIDGLTADGNKTDGNKTEGNKTEENETEETEAESKIPSWQRWNDYGIGLFLEGKAELKQAEEAFRQVEMMGRFDGPLNLARVLLREGRIDEAVDAIHRASLSKDPAAPEWTLSWLSGMVNREQGRLLEAEENFRRIVDQTSRERLERGFDFSRDVEVLNMLGRTLLDQAQQMLDETQKKERVSRLQEAAKQYHRTLAIDSENVSAHYNLGWIYSEIGEKELALKHQEWHLRYKPDDNAQGLAIRAAREKYPHANAAAEALVIYPLIETSESSDEETTK